MGKNYFFDTNILLCLQDQIFEYDFFISSITLQELENIKNSIKYTDDIKYRARKILHLLDENKDKYNVIFYTTDMETLINERHVEIIPDTKIIACCAMAQRLLLQDKNLTFATNDISCKMIANKIFGLDVESILVKNLDEYTGYKDITLSDEEMSYFYLHLNENIYGCLMNEYLIIRKSDGEVVDYRKWNGEEYKVISYKQISSKFLGKIKPRNPEQTLAFDMLQDKDTTIKVISGGFGTGKDYIMISNAMKLIEDGKYEKLVYVRNAVGVKDANDIGYLPGSKDEKLRPYAMVLADHLGGETGLDVQIMSGTIEIEHLGHIRGRDIKNSIIYCAESENLTKEHVQLLMGRVGIGSVLWMNGDFRQTDSPIFRSNNGLLASVQKLAGHNKFGYVQLKKTERSETAAMADLLD